MGPISDTAAPTRDTLARLLQAKDGAKAAYSAACAAVRTGAANGFTIEQRVVLDLREREALTAAYRADDAYDEALKAFLASQQKAAA